VYKECKCEEIETNDYYYYYHYHWKIVIHSQVQNVSFDFDEIGGDQNGIFGMYEFYDNDSIIQNSKLLAQNSTLYNVNSHVTFNPQYYYPEFAVPGGNYILKKSENGTDGYFVPDLPVKISNGYGQTPSIYVTKIENLAPYTFTICAEDAFADSTYSNLQHSTQNKTISVDINTGSLCNDYWGYFVLPDGYTVEDMTAFYDTQSLELLEDYDYTVCHEYGYNIIVVKLEKRYSSLNLKYCLPISVLEAKPFWSLYE